uniref:Uncharacterized protein n=1 Tax=Anguilla anguilla TaxID=7936 RepID=A0A0E9QX04_ANGAN
MHVPSRPFRSSGTGLLFILKTRTESYEEPDFSHNGSGLLKNLLEDLRAVEADDSAMKTLNLHF